MLQAKHDNEVVANQNTFILAPIPDLGGGVLRVQFKQVSIPHRVMHEGSLGPFSPALPPSPNSILCPATLPGLPWEVMATAMNDSSWNQRLFLLKKAACHLLVDIADKNSSILFCLTFWQV